MENLTSGKGKLFAAMAKAQGQYKQVRLNQKVKVTMKDNKGIYYFDYADLSSMIEATRPALSSNGLTIYQKTVYDLTSKMEFLITTIAHESGEFDESRRPIAQNLKDQEYGAGLTYQRRYQYAIVAGIIGEEDNDANDKEDSKTESFVKSTPGSVVNKPAATKPAFPAPTNSPGIPVASFAQLELVKRLHKELGVVRKIPITMAEASAEIEELNSFMKTVKKKSPVSSREEMNYDTSSIPF